MRLRDISEFAREYQPAVTKLYSSERADNLGMFIIKEIADLHKDSGSELEQFKRVADALRTQAVHLHVVIEGFDRKIKKLQG